MAADYLYDLSRSFYLNGVVTDGEFDAEKAAALGYSEAQFGPIKEFIGLEVKDTQPLEPVDD